jgi:hypothetical protein
MKQDIKVFVWRGLVTNVTLNGKSVPFEIEDDDIKEQGN